MKFRGETRRSVHVLVAGQIRGKRGHVCCYRASQEKIACPKRGRLIVYRLIRLPCCPCPASCFCPAPGLASAMRSDISVIDIFAVLPRPSDRPFATPYRVAWRRVGRSGPFRGCKHGPLYSPTPRRFSRSDTPFSTTGPIKQHISHQRLKLRL